MRPIQENDVFHAIAHPARRAILVKLRGGERAASGLAAPFRMTFPAISQHLRVLEEADLVSVRRDGRHRLYRLNPKPLKNVVRLPPGLPAIPQRQDFPRGQSRSPSRIGNCQSTGS